MVVAVVYLQYKKSTLESVLALALECPCVSGHWYCVSSSEERRDVAIRRVRWVQFLRIIMSIRKLQVELGPTTSVCIEWDVTSKYQKSCEINVVYPTEFAWFLFVANAPKKYVLFTWSRRCGLAIWLRPIFYDTA
jgi:hypothetical protein